jgi:hypothetical protein
MGRKQKEIDLGPLAVPIAEADTSRPATGKGLELDEPQGAAR